MSKCGRIVLKTQRYDSVKCPALAVFAKSRARHVSSSYASLASRTAHARRPYWMTSSFSSSLKKVPYDHTKSRKKALFNQTNGCCRIIASSSRSLS